MEYLDLAWCVVAAVAAIVRLLTATARTKERT